MVGMGVGVRVGVGVAVGTGVGVSVGTGVGVGVGVGVELSPAIVYSKKSVAPVWVKVWFIESWINSLVASTHGLVASARFRIFTLARWMLL